MPPLVSFDLVLAMNRKATFYRSPDRNWLYGTGKNAVGKRIAGAPSKKARAEHLAFEKRQDNRAREFFASRFHSNPDYGAPLNYQFSFYVRRALRCCREDQKFRALRTRAFFKYLPRLSANQRSTVLVWLKDKGLYDTRIADLPDDDIRIISELFD